MSLMTPWKDRNVAMLASMPPWPPVECLHDQRGVIDGSLSRELHVYWRLFEQTEAPAGASPTQTDPLSYVGRVRFQHSPCLVNVGSFPRYGLCSRKRKQRGLGPLRTWNLASDRRLRDTLSDSSFLCAACVCVFYVDCSTTTRRNGKPCFTSRTAMEPSPIRPR